MNIGYGRLLVKIWIFDQKKNRFSKLTLQIGLIKEMIVYYLIHAIFS